MALELLAPAKLNLCLHVVGRRPDGYHELLSLMCCVALFDRIQLHIGASADQIDCNHPEVPADETNLAMRAVSVFNRALDSHTRIRPLHVAIRLDKQIPVGGGLGGGSSDAACVLKGLNQFHGNPFDRDRLMALALGLGADVPFFSDQRPALASGIGERLEPYRGLPSLGALLIYPAFGISTSEVFKNLKLGLTKSKKKLRYLPFKNGKFSANHHLHNDLETGVIRRFPVIEKIKKALKDQGAIGSLMTGSGSTVFGLFKDEAAAQKAQEELDLLDIMADITANGMLDIVPGIASDMVPAKTEAGWWICATRLLTCPVADVTAC